MKYQRIPYLVVYSEQSAFMDTYAGEIGKVVVENFHLKPEVDSDAVVIFSHPIGGGGWLPLVGTMVRNGIPTIYCNPRYRGNDTALIMERAAMDLAATVRDAKERLGYNRVYLGGWSGGGSLSMFYQAEAQYPRVTHTRAGDPLRPRRGQPHPRRRCLHTQPRCAPDGGGKQVRAGASCHQGGQPLLFRPAGIGAGGSRYRARLDRSPEVTEAATMAESLADMQEAK